MLKSMSFLCSRGFLCAVLTLSAAVLLCAVSASAATEKVLYTFQGGSDGGYPNGDLVFDAAGNLYGTTSGGSSAASTVFELSPDGSGGWTKTTLYSFDGLNDGAEPIGGVILDRAGNLYGTTLSGGGGCATHFCGTVFELSPSGSGGWIEKILYSFTGFQDGWEPGGSLVFDSAGNLYGVTIVGGVGNGGTAFELSPNADGRWSKRTIFNFSGNRGANPFCHLVMDSSGNLYGTTDNGGPGSGVVFELLSNPDGKWSEHVLHSFGLGQDGLEPAGSVVLDQAGNVYGATAAGGSFNEGTIFELVHVSNGIWKERILHNFKNLSAGISPVGSPAFDSVGNLYGLTSEGGTNGCIRAGCGTAFELSPHTGYWSDKLLLDFSVNLDGGFPTMGPTLDSAGNVYGTTFGDSSAVAYGAVFEIIP